jgi:hypothetical protein
MCHRISLSNTVVKNMKYVYLRRVSHVDQEMLAILKHLIEWGSCYSLFSFLCNVCPFLLDLPVSDCPIGIFKLCLSL